MPDHRATCFINLPYQLTRSRILSSGPRPVPLVNQDIPSIPDKAPSTINSSLDQLVRVGVPESETLNCLLRGKEGQEIQERKSKLHLEKGLSSRKTVLFRLEQRVPSR